MMTWRLPVCSYSRWFKRQIKCPCFYSTSISSSVRDLFENAKRWTWKAAGWMERERSLLLWRSRYSRFRTDGRASPGMLRMEFFSRWRSTRLRGRPLGTTLRLLLDKSRHSRLVSWLSEEKQRKPSHTFSLGCWDFAALISSTLGSTRLYRCVQVSRFQWHGLNTASTDMSTWRSRCPCPHCLGGCSGDTAPWGLTSCQRHPPGFSPTYYSETTGASLMWSGLLRTEIKGWKYLIMK